MTENIDRQCPLSDKKCIPCKGTVPPLHHQATTKLLAQLSKDWKILHGKHLVKEFNFQNFKQALDFTVAVGTVAEMEGHHPDIYLSYGRVKIEIWTHKINGLTESDFILASKIDNILR